MITPISFCGAQRIKIKNYSLEDYAKGYNLVWDLPQEKLDIQMRKYSSNQKYAEVLRGILDGISDSQRGVRKIFRLEVGNHKGKL